MPPQSNLHLASNIAITTALSNLRLTYNGQNGWLNSATNKYVIDTINEIGRDRDAGTINSAEIVDYMATSVLIHSFNGWSYLSNALNALLEGDYGNAIHNAYYAELRSIFSILASQGIGVYDKKNVLVDLNGDAHKIVGPHSPTTHQFAKKAFDEWLNTPANSQTILSLFTVDNLPLKDWIYHTTFSSQISSELASSKLQQWSLDLNVIGYETNFRNFVSYNPLTFELNHTILADNIENRLRFTEDLWKLCSPNNLFSYSILRNTFENLYRTQGIEVKDLDMESDWARIFIDLGRNIDDIQNQNLIKFLKREINVEENLVFNYADSIRASNPVLESDVDPFGIISRACIMLMLNTKMIESILRQSGTSKNDLKFWFDNIGLKSGFWNGNTEPSQLSDLWLDVELELEDIKNWLNDPNIVKDAYNYRNDLKSSNLHIRNFGKAYLWNTGL